MIEYDCNEHEEEDIGVFSTNIPNTKEVKLLLKVAFVRADKIGYRYGRTLARKTTAKKKKNKRAKLSSILFLQKCIWQGHCVGQASW